MLGQPCRTQVFRLNKLHQIIRIPPGILDNKTTNVVFFRWYVLLSSFLSPPCQQSRINLIYGSNHTSYVLKLANSLPSLVNVQ